MYGNVAGLLVYVRFKARALHDGVYLIVSVAAIFIYFDRSIYLQGNCSRVCVLFTVVVVKQLVEKKTPYDGSLTSLVCVTKYLRFYNA